MKMLAINFVKYVEKKISKIKKEKIYILNNGINSGFTGFSRFPDFCNPAF